MSDFNAGDYFASRFRALAEEEATNPASSKYVDLQRASAAKIARLQEIEAQNKAAYEKSLVGRLGLDPNGYAAFNINNSAAVASGLAKAATNAFTAPSTALGYLRGLQIPEEVRAAGARLDAGAATPEDIELLKQPVAWAKEDLYDQGMTNLDVLAEQKSYFDFAKQVQDKADLSGLVYEPDRQAAAADNAESFRRESGQFMEGVKALKEGATVSGVQDVVGGAAGLLATMGNTVVDHPKAVVSFLMENIPQYALAATKAGSALTNIPYAVDAFREGVSEYQKNHNGSLPPQEALNAMATDAIRLAVAETASDALTIGKNVSALRDALKGGKKATEGLEPISRSTFKNLLRDTKNVGKATTEGVVGEGATEAYQTYVEEKIKGKTASPEDVFFSGTIGAILGGGTAGSLHGAAELVGSTPEKIEKRAQEVSKRELQKAAIDTGDVSKIEDPNRAIAALQGNAKLPTATQETKQRNFEQATQIVEDLEAKREETQGQLNRLDPESIKATMADLDAELPQAKPERQAEIVKAKELWQGLLEDIEKSPKAVAQQASKLQAQIAKLDRQIGEARTTLDAFHLDQQATNVDVEEKLATIEANTDPKATQDAADSIMNLAMAAPERVDEKAVSRLLSGHGLTDQQRSYFRAFNESRLASNLLQTMGGVSEEIYSGGKENGNVGIAQYRQRMAQAIAAGNKEQAERQLAGLSNFAKHHADKARVAKEALAQGRGTQFLRPKRGVWQINPNPIANEKARRKAGILVADSPDLVNRIHEEAKALKAAETELKAAYATKFNQPTTKAETKGAGNVKDAPRTQGTRSTGTNDRSASVQGATQAGDSSSGSTGRADADAKPSSGVGQPSVGAQSTENTEISQAAPAAPSESEPTSVGKNQSSETTPSTASTESSESTVRDEKPTVDQPDTTADQVKGTTESNSQPEGEPEVRPVGLRVFQRAKETFASLNEKFLKGNLIAEYFTQDTKGDRYKTQKPLASINDFFSAWKESGKDGFKFVADFIDDADSDFSAEQQAALRDLYRFLNQWRNAFTGNLREFGKDPGRKDHPDFKHRDMLQYLLEVSEDGSVDLDENVKTAMAYSAYQWLLTQSNNAAYLTDDQIKTMHSQDEDSYLSAEGRGKLRSMTSYEHTAADHLGSVAVQVLGLKLKPDASQDMMARLKTNIGTQIILELEKQGFIKRENMSSRDVALFFVEANNEAARQAILNKFKPEARNAYIRLVREKDEKGRPVRLQDRVQAMREANRGARSIVDKLFGADIAPRIPSSKPVKFRQKFAKHTHQEISKEQRKVIQETMNTPHTAIPLMRGLFFGMGDTAILEVAGWRDPMAQDIQKARRESVEAQNQNLERQLDMAKELIEKNPDAEWYVEQEVWKNFRAGFLNQALNMQTSKIHRYLFQRPSWEVEIDLNNEEMVNKYLVMVGMNLGLKTDQQPDVETLEIFKKKIEGDAEIKRAVDAIRRNLLESTEENPAEWASLEDIGAVKNAARKREGMMSLQALVSYAQYVQAVEKGEKSFRTTLLVGADGKTNGPILTHLALGAAKNLEEFFKLLNRGGFYSTDEGQADHFSQYYKGDGAMDLYQFLGTEIVKHLSERIAPAKEIERLRRSKNKDDRKLAQNLVTAEQVAAIEIITKALTDKKTNKLTSAGRNIVKTPLTAFAFGSALKKSIEGMTNGFIESIYDAIEEVNNSKRTDISEEDIFNAMNVLIEAGNYKTPKLRRDQFKEPMEFEFSERAKNEAQEAALRAGFEKVLGSSVESTMKEVFYKFIERRRTLNKTIQASYYTYKVAFDAAVEKEQQRLMDTGELAFRVDNKGNRQPKQVLTVAQLNRVRESIKDLLPVMHTAYSLREDNIGAGLYMAKTEQTSSSKPLYEAQTAVVKATDHNGKPTSRVNNTSMELVEKDPGVAGTPYSIHSSDSSNIHLAMGEVKESMNVHDEIANSIAQIANAARAINKATLTTFLNYSPAREALNMLTRQLLSLNEKAKSGEVSPETVVALFKSLADNYNKGVREEDQIEPQDAVQRVMLDAVGVAHAADDLRLQAFSKLKTIDQYTWEGGQYEVTKDDRELAEQMRSELVGTPSKDLREAADSLLTIYENATKEGTEANVKVEETDAVDSPPATPTASPFGQLGTPAIESDEDLVDWFDAFLSIGETALPARDVIPMLKKRFSEDTTLPNRKFNMMLLSQLDKVIPKSLKINYVNPTRPVAFPDGPVSGARGWYALRADEIYVLSPEYVDSGLTPETLLHELVHAAIARIVHEPGNADAKALVDELEELRKEAKKYAEANSLSEKYAPALANVQEFIAWGMTNQDFQKDVLTHITMKSKNWKNELISGMKLFIKNLAGLLFKRADERRQEIVENGLGILIANVSGLMNEAARVREKAFQSQTKANLAMASQAQAIDNYGTVELFQKLDNGSLTEEFAAHVEGLLGGIVLKLHGPLGSFKESLRKTEARHPLAVWLKALETGKAPFASQIVGSPLASSAQEDFAAEQVEATVRAAIDANEAYTQTAYKQLSGLYEEVRKKLHPRDFFEGDWNTASPNEKNKAREQYEFVFKMEEGKGGKSDYLARFAALGLTNQKFNSLLKFSTEGKALRAEQSFADRLQNLFVKILEFFNGKLTHTYTGQPADQKLSTLVEKLVDIEAKQRLKLASAYDKPSFLAPVENAAKTVSDAVRGKVEDIAGSGFVRNSPKALVRGAGAVARTVAGNRVDKVLDGMTRMRDREFKGRQGVVAGLINYTRGPLEKFEELLRYRKTQERDRKTIITQTGKQSMDAFINGGKDLSDEAKASITNVFLRTGAHHLMDHFSLAEISNLISNEDARNKAIKALEAKLYQFGPLQYQLIEQANTLGQYKATGRVVDPGMLKNAHNIARGYGTYAEGKLTDEQVNEAIPTLEALIALYSVGYSDSVDLMHASEIFRAELLRNGENGVEFVLKLHKQLMQESLEKLFHGNPVQMEHGYIPEIVDPHVTVEHANAEQGEELKNRGFVKVGELTKDPADPDQGKRGLYVLKGVGMQSRLSGAISLTSEKAKGTQLHSGFVNPNTTIGLENASKMADMRNAHAKAAQARFQKGPRRDLSQAKETFMAPVLDDQGRIVNYAYLMQSKTRDSVLRRDSRVDRVLGAFAGSVYDKVASKEQNKDVIKALKEQYDAEHEERPESYVLIGAKATDPEFKEIWALLPEHTKDAARRIWGYNGMMVRSDSLDIIFGYRKQSLATMFQKDPEVRGHIEKFITWFPEHLLYSYARVQKGLPEGEAIQYAKRAATMVTKGERMWQEIVRETKDIIVVKTGTVLLGNIWSNFSLLALQGVSVKDMVHHHIVAMKGATAYWADSEELARNERLLSSGYTQGNEAEIRRNIVRLKDALARNPVKKLIDAGLMPTIVEDVAQDDDPYSYKSLLTQKTEGVMNRVPKGLRSAARMAYMSHDTKMYQGLSRMTQLSDFVARYTLYQHLTTKKDPLSEKAAIQEASDAFIHYDIPMHRDLQYIDDMGIIPFMKYYLGIQRVLLKVSREHPARVLTTVLLGNLMDLGPIVLDSSFIHRIGNNPLQMGALKFPTVWDDLATVNAAFSLLK